MKDSTILSIEYRFTLADGMREVFSLELDAKSLNVCVESPEKFPSWTELTFHQCPHCRLESARQPHCPLAVNIAEIVKRFDHLVSYDRLHLEVVTQERITSQDTSAQQAVSSLMGLLIANSGCPHMTFFKPMARFHLPLASVQETMFRAVSSYLLAQYFLMQEGRPADFKLVGLEGIYDDVHLVNRSMAERLRAISNSDISANAVILLDLYAQAFPLSIEKMLVHLRHLFLPFLQNSR